MTSRRLRSLLVAAACGTALAAVARPAGACGARPGPPTAAFPGPGATEVSPQSSIFIGSPYGLPAGLTIEANGQPVPLPPGQPLGGGLNGSWWRFAGGLSPSTSYVVRVNNNSGVPVNVLTSFTTAAAYDKAPGTPAQVTGLRLWRVHYPDRAAASDCVHAEYEGYIDLVYQPGSLPGTPPDEVINVLSLSPKTGGAPQTFIFTGSKRLHFNLVENYLGNELVDVPPGRFPSPVHALWKPELAPDREYCATLTLYGRNDLAALPATSQTVCAPVMNLVFPNATAPDGGPEAGPPEGPKDPPGDGGTTKIAPPRDPGLDAGSPAQVPDAGVSDAAPAEAPSSGCGNCSMGRRQRPAGLGLLLIGLVLVRLRRRARYPV